jgi:hypothetical protein
VNLLPQLQAVRLARWNAASKNHFAAALAAGERSVLATLLRFDILLKCAYALRPLC